ncbi:E3 ubiquitin-protein ligase MARCH2, partial [Danaus plexippus plexippus]
MAIMTIM